MIDRRGILSAGVALLGAPMARAAPRTATRDLSGVWTNAWYTYLQRPKAFKTLVLTPAEAEAYEAPRRALNGEVVDSHDELGQATSEFPDNGPGLARIRGEIRSSWIVDPANGRVPWSAAGKALVRREEAREESPGDIEERPTDERCLTTAGAGAPILNTHDGNILQIVQTPDWVAIVGEKNHETRIVPLGARGRVRPPPGGSWLGASVGSWDGPTLVVETTGLRPGVTKISDELYLSDQAQVTERFTRIGPSELSYDFAVQDPVMFTQAWRAECLFRASSGLLYEYACHEGNYSLPGILTASRQKDSGAREVPKGQ